jgi:ribonuclease P protein subunit POP4
MTEIRRKDILKHELIGLECEIVLASDPTLVGKKGVIVDETMRTLLLDTFEGEKRIPKKIAVIKVNINKEEVIIQGKRLIGRPEDRVKNKCETSE